MTNQPPEVPPCWKVTYCKFIPYGPEGPHMHGHLEPNLPEGEQLAEKQWYRPPKKGDRFLSNETGEVCECVDELSIIPHIILKPKPKPRVWIAVEKIGAALQAVVFTGTEKIECEAQPLVIEGPEGEALIERLSQVYWSSNKGNHQNHSGIRVVLNALVKAEGK